MPNGETQLVTRHPLLEQIDTIRSLDALLRYLLFSLKRGAVSIAETEPLLVQTRKNLLFSLLFSKESVTRSFFDALHKSNRPHAELINRCAIPAQALRDRRLQADTTLAYSIPVMVVPLALCLIFIVFCRNLAMNIIYNHPWVAFLAPVAILSIPFITYGYLLARLNPCAPKTQVALTKVSFNVQI